MQILPRIVGSAIAIAMFVSALPSQARQRSDTLTNSAVIAMVDAKLPTDRIIRSIKTSPAAFDVTAAGLVSLTKSKVPKEIMRLMLNAPRGAANPKSAPPRPK